MTLTPNLAPRSYAGPLDFADSLLARAARQPLMLDLFLPTQTGSYSQSAYPCGTRWEFDYNKALTLKAESHGFDFVF